MHWADQVKTALNDSLHECPITTDFGAWNPLSNLCLCCLIFSIDGTILSTIELSPIYFVATFTRPLNLNQNSLYDFKIDKSPHEMCLIF